MKNQDNINEEHVKSLEMRGDVKFLWKKVGFHRPLASFWWNYSLILVLALPGLLVVGVVIPQFIMPFPTALGFSSLTTQYFGLFFTIMDMCTAPAVQRFVAEYSIKDPRRAVKYIQFFIWFQMFTGLIQVTGVAIYCIWFMPRNIQYAMWFFLIYSTTQYPGMLASYNGALGGFQRFDQSNKVAMIQSVLLQSATQIIFILLGRWIGMQFPVVGELMGATYGYIIGTYLDDFLAMALAAHYFSKILKPLGFTLRDTIRPDFEFKIVKQCLIFGGKLVGAHIINTGVNFAVLLMVIEWLPNYATITGLYGIADGIARIITISFTITPAISESFNNKKENLTKFIVESQWKHWFLLSFFLTVQIAIFIPPVLAAIGGNYAAAAWMIPILLISRFFVFPINFGSDICQGCDKPEYRTYALAFEQTARFFSYFLLISPFGLLSIIGEQYAIVAYLFADLPAYLTKLTAQWYYVQKKTIKTRFSSPWQTFIVPVFTVLTLLPLSLLLVNIFNILHAEFRPDLTVPIIYAAVGLLMLLFTFPILIFFLYGLYGGWDDYQLLQFKNAMLISGPSKGFVKILYKTTKWAHEHSKLANKFPIPHEKAEKEAMELTIKKLNAELKPQGE
ncbi:MAG: hypothetical protein ACFFCS_24235 [Candidatus Hodarchaeota archaeon]